MNAFIVSIHPRFEGSNEHKMHYAIAVFMVKMLSSAP